MKKNRKDIIAETISSCHVHTQEELANILSSKGINVTQATLSRDIKSLGAVKIPDSVYGIHYSLPSTHSKTYTNHAINVSSIDISGQLCVIKCRPAYASAVADIVDSSGIKGIMGSIAGDDTVLVMLKDNINGKEIEASIRSLFNISDFVVRTATKDDVCHAEKICEEIYISSQERKTGIAKRTPAYICEKILAGKAVIATTSDGEFAGFSYIESWGGKSFVANSGLIVAHKFRGMGVAKRVKEQTFMLSRSLFPHAKIFSITTGAAVMKMNYEFGFRPVPFSELTDDQEFWKGCEGCRHFDILKSHDYKMCICTGLLYDPEEHLEIHHPGE